VTVSPLLAPATNTKTKDAEKPKLAERPPGQDQITGAHPQWSIGGPIYATSYASFLGITYAKSLTWNKTGRKRAFTEYLEESWE